MRLVSLTVKNYRIHRERTVTFDDRLNVLGGPNEVGKSTLAEAVHRAFFLRANVTGSTRDEMLSRPAAGHPEVEVCFEAHGETWTLRKLFSGGSGSTQLSRAGETTLSGDEAEARLQQLLGGEDALGGRQASQLDGKWAHLWVWQGRSGSDPSSGLRDQAERLMARLQSMGGAGLFVSERDSRTAQAVAERYDTLFTQAGNPRKNSESAQREEEELRAEDEASRRAEAVQKLEDAALRYRTAGTRIEDARKAVDKLEAERHAVQARLKKAADLDREREAQVARLERTRKQLEEGRGVDREIRSLRDEIDALRGGLESEGAEVEALEEDRRAHVERHETGAKEMDEAAEAARTARAALDAARAAERWVERRASVTELEGLRDRMEAVETEIQDVTRRISELPAVTEGTLEELRGLEDRRVRADERLRAIAAEIEVLASDGTIRWNDEPLAAEEPRRVTEEGELRVGEGTRIRIRPGGGQTLAEERVQTEQLAAEIARTLEACGCASLEEARTALKDRARLEGQRDQLRSKRDGLSGEAFEDRLRRAREDVTEAEGVLVRLGRDPAEAPEDLDGVREAVRSAADAVTECEKAEERLRQELAELTRRRNQAEGALEVRREALRTHQSEMDKKASNLELLESRAGHAEARAEALRHLEQLEEKEAHALSETEEVLAALDAPQLEADRERLDRALGAQRDEQAQADRDRAAAGALLESNGSMDPYADLKAANAALGIARERQAAARLKADAVKLLHELFEDEKETLTRSLAAPLEERVNEYLRAVFQDGSEIALSLEGTSFTTPALRREERFDFHELSGGAKEQFAAAVRLAVAEVLAEEHDGALPVIFDDAFAYSDSERVGGLVRALDLAARRGLQVVLITCTPEDYAGLGGRLIRLERGTGV